jgi:type IV secretory pathway VirD2 relaxase
VPILRLTKAALILEIERKKLLKRQDSEKTVETDLEFEEFDRINQRLIENIGNSRTNSE